MQWLFVLSNSYSFFERNRAPPASNNPLMRATQRQAEPGFVSGGGSTRHSRQHTKRAPVSPITRPSEAATQEGSSAVRMSCSSGNHHQNAGGGRQLPELGGVFAAITPGFATPSGQLSKTSVIPLLIQVCSFVCKVTALCHSVTDSQLHRLRCRPRCVILPR